MDNYKNVIKKLLTKRRYEHSINVSKVAEDIASRYGISEKKARVAGLLHDITKNMSNDEQLDMMDRYNITMSASELNMDGLWHAKTGAEYVQEMLLIDDQEIINAIRYHTTGRVNMSDLEKVIFIADAISEDRVYNGVDIVRKAVKRSLNEGLLAALSASIEFLAINKKPIHNDTWLIYNEILFEGIGLNHDEFRVKR